MTEPIYCIIGASGFLGQHLLRHLVTGDVRQVRCLSRKQQRSAASIEWLRGSLHDEGTLQNLIVKDSIVINLGFDASATGDANVAAARALRRACVRNHAQRLLHISTATVVGKACADLIDESTPCEPVSGYERTKFAIERALLLESTHALPTTVIRPTAVFGAGGQNLVKLAQNMANGNAIIRYVMAFLHGMRCMNLVASRNVVAAILYLAGASSQTSQGVYIVSDDDSEHNNYAYVASRLGAAFGNGTRGAPAFSLPAPMLNLLLRVRGRSNINPDRCYSCKKLLDAGFVRPVAFEDALDTYAAHLAAQWVQYHRLSG